MYVFSVKLVYMERKEYVQKNKIIYFSFLGTFWDGYDFISVIFRRKKQKYIFM